MSTRIPKAVFAAVAILCTSSNGQAQNWIPMPLVSDAELHAGIFPGGEGAQATRCVAISESDPNFVMMGTDVGGIYRSLNGGKYWQVCMVGWNPRGANAIAIDPRNSHRVIAFGGNSMDWNPQWGASPNGIYLSTDQGASWKEAMPFLEGNEWRLDSICFDPTSFDRARGYCTVVYYDSRDGGLYKSTDGGETWAAANPDHSGCEIKVSPVNGALYLADSSQGKHGVYRSTDGGKTFQQVSNVAAFDLDVIATQPSALYVAVTGGVDVSTDGGDSFHPAGAEAGLDPGTNIVSLKVSPANPKRMLCNHGGVQWWESYTLSSDDGGASWHPITIDKSQAFLPLNQQGGRFVFSPKDADVAYCTTGTSGWITMSHDGGKTFAWRNNGENAIMLGASFGFSAASPNSVYLSFQDFDGATTTNGGRIWTYRNPAGNDWGGYEYGGFALNDTVMWTGDAPGWTGKRTLKVSRDGGATWTVANDAGGAPIQFEGSDVSFASPSKPSVCFASNWRSADSGSTWQRMTNCDGVFTASATGDKALFGKHGDRVCTSIDDGVTWVDRTPDVPGGLRDIAYDPRNRRIYVASEDKLKSWNLDATGDGNQSWIALDTPKDQRGATHIWSVAVDPGDPAIVYAGGTANIYATTGAVVRSTDAGKTWTNLTVMTPLSSPRAAGGPHEVEWLRVHPVTHDLWAAGECYGMWRYPAPHKH